MKAITIIQPWATLIALGEKRFETRGWPTKHRGELAIHAGKKVDKDACMGPEISAALARHGYAPDNLPTGVVLCKVNLKDCHKVISVSGVSQSAALYADGITRITGNEFAFGWYEQGRYAWELTEAQQLAEPIPAKGQQRLWNWEEVKA